MLGYTPAEGGPMGPPHSLGQYLLFASSVPATTQPGNMVVDNTD